MSLTRALIFITLIAAVAWIAAVNLYGWGYRVTPVPIGFDYALNDNLKLPKEVIDKEFSSANERALDQNRTGTSFRLAGDIASWVSFAATAAITLIAGFQGRMSAAPGQEVQAEGLSPVSVRIIAILAALGAVMTACSKPRGIQSSGSLQKNR